jgi:hypothetical protein
MLLRRKKEILQEKSLNHNDFIHYKSYTDWLGMKPGPPE